MELEITRATQLYDGSSHVRPGENRAATTYGFKTVSETALASMDSSQVHRATKHRMKNQHCAFMCIGQTPVAPHRHANHLGVAVYPSHPLSRMKPRTEIPVLTKPAVTLGYGKSQAVEDRSPHTKGQAIKSKDKAAPYKQK